jgi:hypothetical protein
MGHAAASLVVHLGDSATDRVGFEAGHGVQHTVDLVVVGVHAERGVDAAA